MWLLLWYWYDSGKSRTEWARYDTLADATVEYAKRIKEFDFVELKDTTRSELDGSPFLVKCFERGSERRVNL